MEPEYRVIYIDKCGIEQSVKITGLAQAINLYQALINASFWVKPNLEFDNLIRNIKSI